MLRWAGPSDVATLVEHRRRMFEAMARYAPEQLACHDGRYRRWISSRLRSGRAAAVIAWEGSRPVASAVVWLRESQPRPVSAQLVTPYILSVFVAPDRRHRGLGGQVTKALVDWSTQRGFSRVVLHASPFGRGLYERLGFERSWEMRTGGSSVPGPDPERPLDEPSPHARPSTRRRR